MPGAGSALRTLLVREESTAPAQILGTALCWICVRYRSKDAVIDAFLQTVQFADVVDSREELPQ